MHPSAKRLVLVTEEDAGGFSEHVPEGIRLLAEIIGEHWIYDSLMSGRGLLWDIWEPEWTKAINTAGYDTIFTSGFDGSEKYVLNPKLLQFVRFYRVLSRDRVEEYPVEANTLARLEYVVGLETIV
ncbi:MAG: hypothetical protein GY943_14625 [Chloroflexi bacterium]|nr:hypothetical protein [Chloroflexota bacterium]